MVTTLLYLNLNVIQFLDVNVQCGVEITVLYLFKLPDEKRFVGQLKNV
jgi:hypothetical protein